MKAKTPKKRKMRERHAGRLERRGASFLAVWMVNGKRFSESTRVKVTDYPTEAEAKAAAETWLARKLATVRQYDTLRKTEKDETLARASAAKLLRSDLNEIEERRAGSANDAPPVTVAEAFERHLNSPDYECPTPQSVRIFRRQFTRFADWLKVNHPALSTMREVSPAVAKEYAADLKAAVGAGTYNAHLDVIKRVWRVLSDEIQTPSPWDRIKKLSKITESTRRALTDHELEIIFDAARKDANGEKLTLLFSLMLYAGMRLGDAACCTWESIKFDRGVIDFVAIKTGARCRPPLVPALRELLGRTPEELRNGFIIPAFAESYKADPTPMSNLVTAFFKRCGIETSTEREGDKRRHPSATAHSFRHTFISKCGNAGVPLAIVAGWVGHLDKKMTEHYFHDDERATQLYAAAIPTMPTVESPAAITDASANAAGNALTIDADTGKATAHENSTEAAGGRFRAFRDAVDGMTAEELDRAAAFIESRRRALV